MTLVLPFDDPAGAGLPELAGGKGSNLIALTAAGFPVPPGFVVTTDAYLLFVDPLDWLDGALEELDCEHPETLRAQCNRLRSALAEVELPPPVEEAIRSQLTWTSGGDGGGEISPAVAVRSSSSLEDLAEAAFAGQHDTYLNVRGTSNVIQRIRDCWISLWGDRAVLYRHQRGFSQRDARMAVVVQRQIHCDTAGVGFSIDPVSGRTNRMVINANYGLGESVVSGECEVDQFVLDKETLAVAERSIGRKEQLVTAAHNGVESRAISPALADRPCLAGDLVTAVGRLLTRVESHCGWPQDIEWGYKAGTLHLLQSRPVTTLQPRWTRDEWAERFPLPMTPLCWDFISVAFRKSLAHSFALMGLPPLRGDWFQIFDDYIYRHSPQSDPLSRGQGFPT
jgi:pyruvate,water dikinase